jgi:hypothetical protein
MWGESDMPQFNAMFGVSFLIYCNILTVFVAVEVLTGIPIRTPTRLSKYHAGAILILVGLVNYFLLVHDGKYKKIAKEFEKESVAHKRRGLIGIWVYIIGSFALPIVIILLAH